MGYPVLQTADIIIYKANSVPVGIDQAPHVELSREITRRFNNFYGNLFPEPQTMLAPTSKVLGTDGRKMSKSYNNSVYLTDPPATVEKKLKTMVTDTARQRKTDPGNPDICPFYETFHTLYADEETKTEIREGCTSAAFGCIECKMKVIPKVLGGTRSDSAKESRASCDARHRRGYPQRGHRKGARRGSGNHGRGPERQWG